MKCSFFSLYCVTAYTISVRKYPDLEFFLQISIETLTNLYQVSQLINNT
jgi:hypothetical protein